MTVRPVTTQISLGIRPVWSESSLCAQWVAKGPRFLHADSKDSDQTGWMPRLIWVFAGRTCYLDCFVMSRLNYERLHVTTDMEVHSSTYMFLHMCCDGFGDCLKITAIWQLKKKKTRKQESLAFLYTVWFILDQLANRTFRSRCAHTPVMEQSKATLEVVNTVFTADGH